MYTPEDKRALEQASHSAEPLRLWASDRVGDLTLIEEDLEELHQHDNMDRIVDSVTNFVRDTQALEVDPSDPTA